MHLGRVFITGDKHGNWEWLPKWCEENKTTKDDRLICLGDASFNYYLDERDLIPKKIVNSCPIVVVCIHGNHEERPSNISSYFSMRGYGTNSIWIESDFPNIHFLDNSVYNIGGKRFLVVGGAYSIDKEYRQMMGWNWYPSEQMTEVERSEVLRLIDSYDGRFDYILSHTAPLRYEPRDLFLPYVDQSKVDKTTEIFLDEVYDRINKRYLDKWLFGHYHSDREITDKVTMLYNQIIQLF